MASLIPLSLPSGYSAGRNDVVRDTLDTPPPSFPSASEKVGRSPGFSDV